MFFFVIPLLHLSGHVLFELEINEIETNHNLSELSND